MSEQGNIDYTIRLCKAVFGRYVEEFIKRACKTDKLSGVKIEITIEPLVNEDIEKAEGVHDRKNKQLIYSILDEPYYCEIAVHINTKKFTIPSISNMAHDAMLKGINFEVLQTEADNSHIVDASIEAETIRSVAEKMRINIRELMGALEEIDHTGIKNYKGRVLNRAISRT